MVSVADASLRVLKTVDWAGSAAFDFRRTAPWLAYHRPPQERELSNAMCSSSPSTAHRNDRWRHGPSDDMAPRMDAGGRAARCERSWRSELRSGAWFSDGGVPTAALRTREIRHRRHLFDGAHPIRGVVLQPSCQVEPRVFTSRSSMQLPAMLASAPVQALHQFKGMIHVLPGIPRRRTIPCLSLEREVPAPIPTAKSSHRHSIDADRTSSRGVPDALSYGNFPALVSGWTPGHRVWPGSQGTAGGVQDRRGDWRMR